MSSTLGHDPSPSIPELLAASEPSISFEFFPPRDDAAEAQLWHALRRLEKVTPSFVSVTYGAGGTTRDRTVRVTARIAAETSLNAMAHLTCVGSSVAELRGIVGQYAGAGIRNIMALRGDPPGGPNQPWVAHPDGLDHADSLVTLLASLGDFTIGVAAFPDKHPESSSLRADARVLARKAELGASFAVTQMVFDAGSWARLRDEVSALGCDLPIIPGLMPVTNVKQLARMALLSGTPVPAAVASRLETVADDSAAVRAVGVEVATELSQALLAEGAPGLHFYTMNRSTASLQVYRNLGLTPARRKVAATSPGRPGAAATAARRRVSVRPAGPGDGMPGRLIRSWTTAFGAPRMVLDGRVFEVADVSVLVAVDFTGVVGTAAYAQAPDGTVEIVSVEAKRRREGIGRLLGTAVVERARALRAPAVRVTATNDNLAALGLWQGLGFALTALRPGAVRDARRIKPEIPLVGETGIPIRDELELTLDLTGSPT